MIRIEHLRKEYTNAVPLKDVNAEIRDGDVISVIGPSGTGNSTLLRCINQLEKPTSGKVFLDGEEITDPKCNLEKVRQRMGMVFQSFNLFGHLTVIENVMLGQVELLKRSRQEAYDRGMGLLRQVGLAEKALNYPKALSGGQKQRIAIARTLAMDPDIILFDEPTSALDPTMVGEVETVIRGLAGTGKTLMIVTHEMAFARAICTRVFYMDEGGVYEDGTPEEIFDRPRKENTRRFIRKLKVLELAVDGSTFDFPGMLGEADRYIAKNQIAAKQARRIRLALEETTGQLTRLLPDPVIRTAIEYSEAEEKTVMTIRYGGGEENIMETGDELAVKVLKSAVSAYEYRYHSEETPGNELVLQIAGQ